MSWSLDETIERRSGEKIKAKGIYRKLQIQECKVFDNLSKKGKYRGHLAVFKYDCGFIYQRLGPDNSEEDKFRFNFVKDYGKVWEDKFKDSWTNLSISGAEIGRSFGINHAK